jgi:inorganic pyrophosphatase
MSLKLLSPFPHKNHVRVVVETPRGSHHKYDFKPELGGFILKKTLPEGMIFPHDFGFVPQTEGEDGDPLDALILCNDSTFPGCIVDCRLIGVIRASQREEGKDWIRNDRYLAIADADERFAKISEPQHIPAAVLEELERFFKNYNELEERRFKVHGIDGSKEALRLLRAGCIFD